MKRNRTRAAGVWAMMDRPILSPAEIAPRFEAAWNAHDMEAFADLFHLEATFVSRFGHFWRGRDEIVARHREIHTTIYRDCTIANEVLALDALSEMLASGVVQSRVAVGRFMPTGPREFSTLFSFLAQQRGGAWRILSGANVALADPQTGEPVLAHTA